MEQFDRSNGIYILFRDAIHTAFGIEAPDQTTDMVEDYVAMLFVKFLRTDTVFALKDENDRPLVSIYEMLAEGDVRLKADSFERERAVHKHIGDYILFWSGLAPNYLQRLKLSSGADLICDYSKQGQSSYHIVSTFDYAPFDREVPIFRCLSAGFDRFANGLGRVANSLSLQLPQHPFQA